MSSIQLSKKAKDVICKYKTHPAETYEQCIMRIFHIVGDDDMDLLTDRDLRDIQIGLEQVKAGKFVTLEQMFKRYKL